MSVFKNLPNACLAGALLAATAPLCMGEDTIEQVVIWAENHSGGQSGYTNPTSLLTREDFASINVATTEDLVKYEPSLVIRRRFIGDSNGTMGIRGSNMFQTSRSMVFADGVPLHYLLQSRWNGAPRWTMVSASEIARVEVIYGPFSAQHSGNAMGGVVSIETAIPQQREFHFDSSAFSQDFDAYGFDGSVSGYKSFLSYGDKFDDLSLYFSYNHLENKSQPQSFYFGDSDNNGDATPVTGALPGKNERGVARLYFGDSGVVDTTTDNYKIKLGYDFGNWSSLLNLAYEDRESLSNSPNSYLSNSAGDLIWSGEVVQNSEFFSLPPQRLGVREQERDSLSLGLRLRGDLSPNASLEANINQFSILRDESRNSLRNPNDPAHTPAGQITAFGDTGWQAGEIKLTLADIGLDGLQLISGFRRENYQLNLSVFDSLDYAAGNKDIDSSRSGGDTAINALFAQANWTLNDAWDLALGLRVEDWKSSDGYFDNDDPATPELDLTRVPSAHTRKTSPKFSLGYRPGEQWLLRYSAGKAYRFAIVEELFSQFSAFNAISVANPALKPEDGLHHNLMLERNLDNGYLRINIYRENIRDAIESQSTTLDNGTSLRTFIPIDEVETRGAEFIAEVDGLGITDLDLRFNIAYADAEIVRNAANRALQGNTFPRMPKWRGNLLATYHISEHWDAGLSLQYAGDSFGRLDNSDHENNVFGAQDGYARWGLKSSYRLQNGISLGLGIDNLTNEIDYVAHPWPGRTAFLNLAYDY